jgi:copper(I)-binding protein
MRIVTRRWLAAAALVVSSGCGSTRSTPTNTITYAPANVVVQDATVVSGPTGSRRAFAYLTVTSPIDDQLVGATAAPDIAALASLQNAEGSTSVGGHEGHLDNEGPSHTHVDKVEIRLPAQQPVTLRAGGSYVRLEGLTRPLQPGQSVVLTLRFARSGQVAVTAVAS